MPDFVSTRQPAHDPEFIQNDQLVGTFVEIIGHVVNESSIKFLLSLNLDSDKELDMKLVNDVVELTFDPRFKKMFPS
ncbi:hypothetical protein J3R83DRAFT_4984 [Lanmaoa asiatica]|nr:hypothetical protein J3R83DRAFT_4984 [Lanmaoa asiatica]